MANKIMSGSRSSASSTQGALFRLCTLLCLIQTVAFSFNLPVTNTRGREPFHAYPSKLHLILSQQSYTPRTEQSRNDLTVLFMENSDTSLPNVTMNASSDTKPEEYPVVKSARYSKAQEEAEELRRRAKEILAEARVLEVALQESRSMTKLTRMSGSNDMIDRLFLNRPLTPEAVARILRDECWSVDQAVMVLERLHERQTRTLNFDRDTVELTNPNFQIGDTRNAKVNATEADLFDSYMNCLIQAAAILDEEISSKGDVNGANKRWPGRVALKLKSRLNELRRTEDIAFRRRLATGINSAMSSNITVQDYMRRTLGLPSDEANLRKKDTNLTRVMQRVAMVPLWVPASLVSSIIASQALIDPKDIRTIKNKVLSKSNFFCTSSDSTPSAAIFRGNVRLPTVDLPSIVRQNQTAVVFADIQQRLETEGLSDRIQLFFLQDPEWTPSQTPSSGPKPVVLALPKAVVPENATPRVSVTMLKRVSVGLTLLSSFGYSTACFALNPKFFDSIVNQKDLTVIATCIPVFVGVLAVQAVHELAHYLVAKARGMKIGLPVPVPSTQLGSFGSITSLRSFPPTQSALIDFALSGPVSAMLLSLVFLVLGAFLTVRASEGALSHFPVVPVSLLKSSFLTGTILSFIAPKALMLPLSQPIPIHPLFMIGFSGLISSALNLLPIFRLDGGRACSAALGNRIGGLASAGTLLFLLSLTLSGGSGVAFAFGMFVVFFQRRPEIPVRDEVTEVDDFRLGAWIASLTTSILALVPFPGGPWFL